MTQRRVAAVLFDMDETLLTHTSTGLELTRAVYEAYRDHLGEIEEAAFARTLWQKANDLWLMMFDGALSGDVARPYSFINALRALHVDDSIAHEMLEDFESRLVTCTRLFDDALPVLKTLRENGVGRGIVTNGYKTLQQRKLDHHGLPEHVDFTLVSEAVGLHKPHPGIFEVALHKAGAKPLETLVVGDNLWADIKGAAATGIPSVLLDPEGTRIAKLEEDETLARPTYVVPELTDVLELVVISGAEVAGTSRA